MKSELQCRWCFAVNGKRVECEVTSTLNYPDSTLLELKCPRCQGLSSFWIGSFSEKYLRQRMSELKSDLVGASVDERDFTRVIDKLYPEYQDC